MAPRLLHRTCRQRDFRYAGYQPALDLLHAREPVTNVAALPLVHIFALTCVLPCLTSAPGRKTVLIRTRGTFRRWSRNLSATRIHCFRR